MSLALHHGAAADLLLAIWLLWAAAEMGIRVASRVRTLGRFFKLTVVIQEGHRVVDRGPYRVLRHPSYTGMLVTLLGIGIMLDNWLALLAVIIIPLPGLLIRIRAEKAALTDALGGQYLATKGPL